MAYHTIDRNIPKRRTQTRGPELGVLEVNKYNQNEKRSNTTTKKPSKHSVNHKRAHTRGKRDCCTAALRDPLRSDGERRMPAAGRKKIYIAQSSLEPGPRGGPSAEHNGRSASFGFCVSPFPSTPFTCFRAVVLL